MKPIVEYHHIPAGCREQFLPLQDSFANPLRKRGVHFAGVSHLVAGYVISRPDPRHHLVLHTDDGGGSIECPGIPRDLKPGSLLLVPRGTPHRYRAGRRWHITFFHLSHGPFPEVPTVRMAATFPSVRTALEGYLWETAVQTPGPRAHTYGALLAEALSLEIGSPRGPDSEILGRFDQVWREVAADLQHPWTAVEIAGKIGLSYAQCARQCTRLYGMAPMHRVARLRLSRAREILSGSDYRLATVAESVGYGDVFAFSVAFKRLHGMNPSQVRGNPADGSPRK